ncbi:MAG: GNAT family N-acetyltransferase [Verrucomicrobiae bacterium]|nr:GNAT family N-acetyltransferase [Verrucomicrobiae bacterium]
MSDPLVIRRMREADLPFADSIRALAGWNQTSADWRRFLALEPEGCFVAEWAGRPTGTATTTRHEGGVAWIGMVLVHPESRRRGIGRALLCRCLEHLDSAGCRCIKLDATPDGRPLYETLGFREEWPLTRWEGVPAFSETACAEGEPLGEADRAALFALDEAAFGVSRRRLLEKLLEESAIRVARKEGRPVAFAMRRPGSRAAYLGPILAEREGDWRPLAAALLAGVAGQPVFWDIPEAAADAGAWAERLGFRRQRPLVRMFRGTNALPGVPAQQHALTDPATG